MKVRKALVWITLVSILVGVGNWFYTFKSVTDSKHLWCQLVVTSIRQAGPIHKPVNPATDPKDEKLWENYQLVIALSDSLGCNRNAQ
jgi:hypothetical protein